MQVGGKLKTSRRSPHITDLLLHPLRPEYLFLGSYCLQLEIRLIVCSGQFGLIITKEANKKGRETKGLIFYIMVDIEMFPNQFIILKTFIVVSCIRNHCQMSKESVNKKSKRL